MKLIENKTFTPFDIRIETQEEANILYGLLASYYGSLSRHNDKSFHSFLEGLCNNTSSEVKDCKITQVN